MYAVLTWRSRAKALQEVAHLWGEIGNPASALICMGVSVIVGSGVARRHVERAG
jgi:hypothetical protein